MLALAILPMGAWAKKSPRASSLPPPVYSMTGPRLITILDPVNLTTGLPDPESGAMLRKTLLQNPAWSVLDGDTTGKLLREYGLDPDLPCMEFQCAYDAGNALQTEFVLFGTTTSLPELHAYTLDLVHVPTSQVIWSRVGEVPKRTGGQRQSRSGNVLEGSLQFAVSDLDPAGLNLRKTPSMGLLGVMDAGQSTPHSRVVLHRALSHAYASRAYDLLGPAELDELMAALDLRGGPENQNRLAAADPQDAGDATGLAGTGGMGGSGSQSGMTGTGGRGASGDDILSVGNKMGVRYLLWSKVETEGRDYKMDLSLYDVPARKLVRHWPARQSSDFNSLLGLEDRFMTALGNGAPISQSPKGSGKSGLAIFGKVASITLATAAGAALGFLAYQNKQQADVEYSRFKQARTEQEAAAAKRNVMEQDSQARRFGALGGLSLAVGAAVWAF
ncbi:MAG: hypothetical protein JWP91_4266 [Fibrobacteres bacterium]|nr:hypothetical protein [Fibrobacterota bacterium]